MDETGLRDTELAGRLRRVREGVRAKAAAGIDYSALEQIEGEFLYGDRDRDFLPELQASLQEVDRLRQVEERPFVSRVPLLGRLIVRFRDLWNRVATKWYVLPILQQQVAFNTAVARCLGNLYRYMALSTLGSARRMDAYFKVLEESQRDLQEQVVRLCREQAEESRRGLALQRTWLERLILLLEGQPAGPVPKEPMAPLERIDPLGDHDYFAFENVFRGSPGAVRSKQESYLPLFQGRRPVLDIGCGRGEFLELLSEHGIESYGIEVNEQMLLVCREKGLDVRHEDVFAHLAGLPNGSLGGMIASHVLEHLPTGRLSEFVRLAFEKLQPGACCIAETPNPTCLWTLVRSFYLDLSHTRPLHPLALAFLFELGGFRQVETRYVNRVPELDQLGEVPVCGGAAEREAFEAIRRNFAQLNELVYGYQDYAVVARK